MKKSEYKSGSQERFGYEWEKFSQIIPEYETQFLKWVYPLKKNDFKDKTILDAGCGIGRNSYWPLTYGAKELLAFDYDKRTIAVARRNLSQFRHAKVIFKSIYDLDLKNKFDIAFSIGVIHHLANPSLAVKKMVDSVKKNGTVLIWVYGYEGNEWIVKYVDPIRKITSRLPLKIVNLFAYFLSIPLYTYVKLSPQKSPYLKQLSRFKFWHLHSIVFDQLIPKIANYWKKEEAEGLLKKAELKDVQIYKVNNNSWTVLGKKK
ncbi:MAG: class I SAM-dependent methyltransferase [Nanoarchaeota archaeon]|nr:class I SAM-dependent methyltransferase [Nanoarchaeota archaeon]